jgi:DNA-binding MarR family transcriptional regulator
MNSRALRFEVRRKALALSAFNVSCYDVIKSILLRYIRSMEKSLTHLDYQALAELRYQIRRFLHFSEQAARSASLEPRQHQLMLALKGLPDGVRPRIRELAERLQIQHHSAVELANRLWANGYVRRTRAGHDRREVLLSLTPKGERLLRELSLHHQTELHLQGPALFAALKRVMQAGRNSGTSAEKSRAPKAKTTADKNGRTPAQH